MKVTQETATLLQVENKQLLSLILSPILILAGAAGSYYLYTTPTNTIPWWVGLCVTAFGLLVLLFNRSLTLTIDKAANKIVLTSKTLFGQTTTTHEISEVEKIQLISQYQQTQVQSGQGTQSQTNLQTSLFLVLHSGQRTLLFNGTAPNIGNGTVGMSLTTPGQAVGQKMATFLAVPFEETGGNSLQQAGTVIHQVIGGSTISTSQDTSGVTPEIPTN